MDFKIDTSRKKATGACTGWLMTSVASWGDTREDAFDQCLVELGLGDSRLIRMEGAMLPMGFESTQPEDLAMGSLVECHVAESYTYDGGTASAGVAWAQCVTPEDDECAIVATIASEGSYEETELLLKRTLKQKLASRDLEVVAHQIAVDEVTAADEHHGCAIAALILPDTLNMQSRAVGRVRGGLTRSAEGFTPGSGASRQVSTKKSGDFSFQL
ncbi:MAG: pyruvoyl-dependent arginine decarboxylase [Candidatus Thalassarchaeaceae archaeon]|jgi:pyruvoyl-dependent arginine decarboxylase (PvlArgDC)|nr:pyruvoyl-dependent arginine decarboxylase [Candidatus Thalassarchaeaceae archaeon]